MQTVLLIDSDSFHKGGKLIERAMPDSGMGLALGRTAKSAMFQLEIASVEIAPEADFYDRPGAVAGVFALPEVCNSIRLRQET